MGVVKNLNFPSYSLIFRTCNPLWGLSHHHEVGRSQSYLHIKFGRHLPLIKNFRAEGVVKNVIFPSFSLIFGTCNTLSRLSHSHEMGRPQGYLHMKFGRNRPVNKNFSAVGVVKYVIFPSFSPISQTSNPLWGLAHHHDLGRP